MMPDAQIIEAGTAFSPDLIFILGAPLGHHEAMPTWRLSATEWSGTINPTEDSSIEAFVGDWAIGAMISALLAANEAFKCAMRRLRLRQKSDEVFFELSRKCHWDFGVVPLHDGLIDFGCVDFISGGAHNAGCSLCALEDARRNDEGAGPR